MSNYSINSLEQYFKVYRRSINKPKKFWGKIAENNFTWYQKWDKVVEFDMEKAEFTWFKNARLNITKNCIPKWPMCCLGKVFKKEIESVSISP